MPSSSTAATAFSERLAEVAGAPLTEPPRQLSGGASRETWSFAAGGRPLIAQLQRVAHDPPRPSQAPLLRAAAAAGVPGAAGGAPRPGAPGPRVGGAGPPAPARPPR